MIESPIGPITLRPPTEAEAIRFEDRTRASRSLDEESSGGLYDNGLTEIVACLTSHKEADIHPSSDGLLAECPGIFDRLCAEFRRCGGDGLPLVSVDVIDSMAIGLGKQAVQYTYDGVTIVARRITWPEYCAFSAEHKADNFWALLARYAAGCIVSPFGDDLGALRAKYPYLAMAVGVDLFRRAQGVGEARAKKPVSESRNKNLTSTLQPQTSSPHGMDGGGGR